MGTITVIVSGKGGAGKTSLAAALGCALAARGEKTVLVDGDLGLRSLDAALGLQRQVVFDLVDVALGLCPMADALVRDSLHPGLSLLAGTRGYERSRVDRWTVMDLAARLRGDFDQVILDAPAGIGEGMQRMAAAADRAILVTLPEATSVRGAREAARRLREAQIETALILNRYRPYAAFRGYAMDRETLESLLPLPLLGVVPETRAAQKLQSRGLTLWDGHGAAGRALDAVAARLTEKTEAPVPQDRTNSNRRRRTWAQEEAEALSGSRSFWS